MAALLGSASDFLQKVLKPVSSVISLWEGEKLPHPRHRDKLGQNA